MRLDLYLFENGFASSRTEAKSFITEGAVTVNGKSVTKPSFDVSGREEITVDRSIKKFASRGGIKLEAALERFKISVDGAKAIDIGASSGGFTDCLLKRGASHVIAVDSGFGQIVDELRRDGRVTVFENYNARYMQPSDFEYVPDLAVMDVSFISATYIIPALSRILSDNGRFVCLIKPQFEVGKENIGKGGVVKSEKHRTMAVKKVTECALGFGLILQGVMESPIQGGDGNTEYLAYFRKETVDEKNHINT
ncbi:MAG: TlyA family RNA methyltransferase [Clostridia bacterium]|nr:TlyA family RNA methyltransferase [Clostridia bacterium]